MTPSPSIDTSTASGVGFDKAPAALQRTRLGHSSSTSSVPLILRSRDPDEGEFISLPVQNEDVRHHGGDQLSNDEQATIDAFATTSFSNNIATASSVLLSQDPHSELYKAEYGELYKAVQASNQQEASAKVVAKDPHSDMYRAAQAATSSPTQSALAKLATQHAVVPPQKQTIRCAHGFALLDGAFAKEKWCKCAWKGTKNEIKHGQCTALP